MGGSDNVDRVRSAMAAWNDRDAEALADYVDPELEWVEMEEGLDMSDRRGHEGLEHVTRDLESAWEGYRLDVEQLEQLDDGRVVAVVRESGRGRASGLELSTRFGYLITLRHGKLVRIEAYRDPQHALDLAGRGGAPLQ